MARSDANTYDAVIIGAGIGGLVCGCYLAKAGMKVLIAEQHHKPGGYCTSFKRKGFTFDAAAHSFGGYRKGGIIHSVFSDLELHDRVEIIRYEPSDIINAPDHTVQFWSDSARTIAGLQDAFPHERNNVEKFFLLLTQRQPAEIAKLGKMTLQALLATYFTDQKLQAILAFPILGNGDLPPSKISAFVAAKIYTEFLIDGGYYPDGGMQVLPNLLAERLKELGGVLLLSTRVTKIDVAGDVVKGVTLNDATHVETSRVISNSDAHQTFHNLIGKEHIGRAFIDKLDGMIPSQGIFVLYLGIRPFSELPEKGSNSWFLPHYNIENMYARSRSEKSDQLPEYYMVRVSPDRKTVLAFVNTPFRDKHFWTKNKKLELTKAFIAYIEKNTIPGLSQHIEYVDAATPATLNRYTLNYRGAAYGWAGLPSQIADRDFIQPSFLKGMYLTGHWTTFGQGIAGVAYIGRSVAQMILRTNAATKEGLR